jgi:hypothetical protein
LIIGLTGYKQAGKDSSADVLVREYGFEKMAFADALRSMALAINPYLMLNGFDGIFERYADILDHYGYEGAKALPAVREFLQVLGTEGVRNNLGPDAWVNALKSRIGDHSNRLIVVADCRFPNEAAFIKNNGALWRIIREGQTSSDQHDSERLIDTLNPDQVIVAANLGQLRERIVDAWRLEMSITRIYRTLA